MGKGGGIEAWDCSVCGRSCDCNEGYERVGGNGPNNTGFRLIDLIDEIRRSGNVWAWKNDPVTMHYVESDRCNFNTRKADYPPVCCLHRDHLDSPSRNQGLPCYGCYNFEGRGREEGSAWADIHAALRADGLESEEDEEDEDSAAGAPQYNTFAEKSAAALSREVDARRRFDRLRIEVEHAGVRTQQELLQPNCHLTGPCYSSFSKYVQAHAGWTVRRRTATDAEKRAYGETRRGKCYFVNVTYQPPRNGVVDHNQSLRARARSPGPPRARVNAVEENAMGPHLRGVALVAMAWFLLRIVSILARPFVCGMLLIGVCCLRAEHRKLLVDLVCKIMELFIGLMRSFV
jgi:hypothetical protein